MSRVFALGMALLVLPAETHAATEAVTTDPVRPRAPAVDDPGETPGRGDGIYGRFLGDLSLRVGLGAEWDIQAKAVRPLVQVETVAYQTLGLLLCYRQGLSSSDEAQNLLSVGVSLSPLFLIRWSRAAESGHAHLDLLLDSITLAPGIVFATPKDEPFGSALGFELGLSAGLPLLPRANGPWFRTRLDVMSGRKDLAFEKDWGTSLWFYLEWQGFWEVGLLDQGDR